MFVFIMFSILMLGKQKKFRIVYLNLEFIQSSNGKVEIDLFQVISVTFSKNHYIQQIFSQ